MWAAGASVAAAAIAAWGADLISKRQERRAITGSYTDLLTQTRQRLNEVDEDARQLRDELERTQRTLFRLRRYVVLLQIALLRAGGVVPPAPDEPQEEEVN